MTRKSVLTLVSIWILWAVILIGFQILAAARFQPQVPDNVLDWTGGETTPGAHDTQPYLLEPFMNQQVAYDSEFYLSIADAGYADPGLRAVWLDPNKEPEPIWGQFPMPFGKPNDGRPFGVPDNFQPYSLNYAFFPFYPLVIRALYYPLLIFGLNPIATATLAGVIVSLVGALGAMFALYDLTRDSLGERDSRGESGAIRTAFYLIAFPTGFFLAMVHTEGLFVGLAFGSLAMLRRKQWILAALLAGFATVTRAVGGALIIPMALAWLQEALPSIRSRFSRPEADDSTAPFRWTTAGNGVLALSPLIAFGIWNALLGTQFRAVEAAFFSRGMFVIQRSIDGWQDAFGDLFGARHVKVEHLVWQGLIVFAILLIAKVIVWRWYGERIPKQVSIGVGLVLAAFGTALAIVWFRNTSNEQRTFYYMMEFAATILALAACAYTLRTMPGVALFSLMVVLISFFSGAPQGMQRYILGAPAVFVMLGSLGQDEVFDRAWTLGSVMLMGLFATLFAANFWIG